MKTSRGKTTREQDNAENVGVFFGFVLLKFVIVL